MISFLMAVPQRAPAAIYLSDSALVDGVAYVMGTDSTFDKWES